MSSCWPCGAWCSCWMRSLQYLRLPFSPFPFPLLLYLYVNHRYSHLYLFIMLCLFLSVFELCMLSWVFPSSKRLSSDFIPVLHLFNLLHASSNSWFAVSKLFKHVYASLVCKRSTASHLWLEWDPRSRHPGSSQGKQSRSHKALSSQRRELRAEDRWRGHGSQRCCLSTLKLWWMQCYTMTWCNGMQWPGVLSFHFVVAMLWLEGGILVIPMMHKIPLFS